MARTTTTGKKLATGDVAARNALPAAGKVKAAAGKTPASARKTLDLISVASENTLAANPLIGINKHEMSVAAKALLKTVVKTPMRAGSHLASYVKELGRIIKGGSELAADPKDKRYADPAWEGNFLLRRCMQVHVATQKELFGFIDTAKMNPMEKGRARFLAALVTDALAPSNLPLINPKALHKIIDTGGKSLVQGAKNLYHDARHNNMLPSSVDATPFKVGTNMATQPGSVVLRHELFELIQYEPTTATVHSRPLLMSPPQVNKYYVVDLAPEKSLIKWIVDSGVQCFVISWRNPSAEHRHWGFNEYCKAIDAAVEAVRQITGSPDINMWGTCSGGMTLAAYLGWLAARGETKVANTTWAVCILNTEAAMQDSMLGLFTTPEALKVAKARSRRRGYISGEEMASMFAWLRPNELIWNYWVNNYLLGNKPPAFDLLAWNADTTRLPAQFHCDLLDLVEKNPYINANTLEINGEAIDFGKVDVGAYVIGGITDHITPWRGCYGTARLFGEKDTTFVLANAGHVQSLVNPIGAPKAFYVAAAADLEDPDKWVQKHSGARAEGSWWPHWRQWIQARSGDPVPARTASGSRKYRTLCAAPGEYILEK